MSIKQATQEEQDGYTYLLQNVHAPIFFEKLAQRGIVPQSPEEQQSLLNMGAQLLQAHLVGQQKQASARQSYITKAAEKLNHTLVERGLVPATSQAEAQEARQIAYHAVQDPTIKAAAVAYTAYLTR